MKEKTAVIAKKKLKRNLNRNKFKLLIFLFKCNSAIAHKHIKLNNLKAL